VFTELEYFYIKIALLVREVIVVVVVEKQPKKNNNAPGAIYI